MPCGLEVALASHWPRDTDISGSPPTDLGQGDEPPMLSYWSMVNFTFTFIIQGGPEKTAQTLIHYNFSTAGHKVTRFPAKCSETNW